MSTDEFTKLFKYMEKRFNAIEETLGQKADKADLNRTLNLFDSMIKRQETSAQESLVMGHQIELIGRWSHELASRVGHKLTA